MAVAEEDPQDLLASLKRRGDIYERMRTIARLGELADVRAVPKLIEVLDEWTDDWLQTEAAKALGLLADARAVPALLKALRADFGEVTAREMIAREGEIAPEQHGVAAAAVVQDLRDQEELQRESARALAKIGGAKAKAGLVALLAEIEATSDRGFTGDSLHKAITAALESFT